MGEHVFADFVRRIDDVSLQSQVIACGFDGDGEQHLLVADGSGHPLEYSPSGFCAIGSGARVATDCFLFYADKTRVNQCSPLEHVLYVSCASKFMAESVPSVGKKKTFVSVFEKNQKVRFLRPLAWQEIKSEWEDIGMPMMDKTFLPKIPAMLVTAEQIQEEIKAMRLASQKSEQEQ